MEDNSGTKALHEPPPEHLPLIPSIERPKIHHDVDNFDPTTPAATTTTVSREDPPMEEAMHEGTDYVEQEIFAEVLMPEAAENDHLQMTIKLLMIAILAPPQEW
eukprot:15326251-Ditylum_brightwellii.AAC.1